MNKEKTQGKTESENKKRVCGTIVRGENPQSEDLHGEEGRGEGKHGEKMHDEKMSEGEKRDAETREEEGFDVGMRGDEAYDEGGCGEGVLDDEAADGKCHGCHYGCSLDRLQCGLGMRLMGERGEEGGSHGRRSSQSQPHGGLHDRRGCRGLGDSGGFDDRHGRRSPDGFGDSGDPHGHRSDGSHDLHGPHDARGSHGPHGSHGFRGLQEGDPDERLAHMFHHAAHLIMHRAGARGGRSNVLAILDRHDGIMSQRILSEKLDVRAASLSELLGKMEAAGSIVREPSQSDRRAAVVRLTDQGTEEARAFLHERSEANKRLFSALDEGEREQLASLMEKLIREWHKTGSLHGGPRGSKGSRGPHGRAIRGSHGAPDFRDRCGCEDSHGFGSRGPRGPKGPRA